MAMHGHFYWNELNTRDPKKAMAFYGQCMDWIFEKMDMESGGKYYICKNGDAMVGGIFTMPSPDFEGIPEHWFSYIAVDDIDKRIETALAAGGALVREPFEIQGTGRIAIVQDSNGANLGWMTPAAD